MSAGQLPAVAGLYQLSVSGNVTSSDLCPCGIRDFSVSSDNLSRKTNLYCAPSYCYSTHYDPSIFNVFKAITACTFVQHSYI